MTSEPKTNQAIGSAIATAVRQARADTFASSVLPIIAAIKTNSIKTDAGIAAVLNARCIPAAKGGLCSGGQVRRVLKRTVRTKQATPKGAARSLRLKRPRRAQRACVTRCIAPTPRYAAQLLEIVVGCQGVRWLTLDVRSVGVASLPATA